MRVQITSVELRTLSDALEVVHDPRMERTKKHLILDTLVIAVLATIADCDGWDDIVDWAGEQLEWLSTFLCLANGIPSADTVRRVFEALDRRVFGEALVLWVRSISPMTAKGTVAIDGKTMRGSGSRASGLNALHMVHAWSVEGRLLLGQAPVDAKSNEIVAVPELLATLDLRGKTVTGDAMNTQRLIAAQIIDQKGDYALAVRGNQPSLEEAIVMVFTPLVAKATLPRKVQRYTERDDGHGRCVERTVWIAPISLIASDIAGQWMGAKTIVYVRSRRIERDTSSEEWRPYISSRSDLSAEGFCRLIRSHWSVENQLHWQLDVSFHEDASRIHDHNAASNLSLVRAIALSLLKRESSYKRGVDAKRRRARNPAYLVKVLAA